MKMFIHTTNGIAITEDLDEGATIGDLIADTKIADATAWAEGVDEPLDPASSVREIGDKGHVHITRCRRVTVTVNYNGRDEQREFPPGATIQAVRVWAVGPDGFNLAGAQRPKHEVGVCGTGVIADHDAHVGTLASDCALCLDLAPKDRFQG